MNDIGRKWDNRYTGAKTPGEPCWVLQHNQHLLPVHPGRSLDLACGLGANACLLAELGFESHAWDLSTVAIEKLQGFAQAQQLTVHTLQRDVESQPPEPQQFDLIIVSQFLHRPSCQALINALKPGGLLYYQTFHQQKLSANGPSSPDFLLAPNELLHLFNELTLLYYREDARAGNLCLGKRESSYLIGQKPTKMHI